MANINVKEILKKLSFFKNNLSLLAAIFIAAVALLLFIPTRILGSKLRKTMEQRAGSRTDHHLAAQSARGRGQGSSRWSRTSTPIPVTSTRSRT